MNQANKDGMMISFITDDKPGESVILEPVRYADLRIADLEGRHIETIPAPAKGWTHEILEATAQQLAAKRARGLTLTWGIPGWAVLKYESSQQGLI